MTGFAAALAPLSEGSIVCTVTDSHGNPVPGEGVTITLEGAGRILSGRQLSTDERGKVEFVYEAPSTEGDVLFRVRAAGHELTWDGQIRIHRLIEHDAPESVGPLSATRIKYYLLDDEGMLVTGREMELDLLAGVGQIVDEEPVQEGTGAFTYLAKHTIGGAVFEVRAGSVVIRIPVAVE